MGCTSTCKAICQHQYLPLESRRCRENKSSKRMHPYRNSRQPSSYHAQQSCFGSHRMHHHRLLPQEHIQQPTQRNQIMSQRNMPFHRDTYSPNPVFLLGLIQFMSRRRQQHNLVPLLKLRQHPRHKYHRHRDCTGTDNLMLSHILTSAITNVHQPKSLSF